MTTKPEEGVTMTIATGVFVFGSSVVSGAMVIGEFLMTSADWEKVFAAFIIAFFAYLTARIERVRSQQRETKTLINGRMEEMKAQERDAGRTEGYALGLKAAAKGVVDSPNIDIGVKEMAQVMVDNVQPPAPEKK